MLGPTGAGKSASLNYLCMLMMAIYRPRLVIVDAGKSFDLLKSHFAAQGLDTFSVELTPIPPCRCPVRQCVPAPRRDGQGAAPGPQIGRFEPRCGR